MMPVLTGIVQWFQFGDTATVSRALRTLNRLGITHLRTGFSWADWSRGGDGDHEGRAWYDWLSDQFGDLKILPVFAYTPPSIAVNARTNGAPRDLSLYADWVAEMIGDHGHQWTHVELWNEPNGYGYWHRASDPDWRLFVEMVSAAADRAHELGVGTVFPGASPNDPGMYATMASHDAFAPGRWDVIGVHGFPGTWEDDTSDPDRPTWRGWQQEIEMVRSYGFPEVWVTETGFSHHERPGKLQAAALEQAYDACELAGVRRFYWYSLFDLPADVESTSMSTLGSQAWNPHEYAMGAKPETLAALGKLVRRGE